MSDFQTIPPRHELERLRNIIFKSTLNKVDPDIDSLGRCFAFLQFLNERQFRRLALADVPTETADDELLELAGQNKLIHFNRRIGLSDEVRFISVRDFSETQRYGITLGRDRQRQFYESRATHVHST